MERGNGMFNDFNGKRDESIEMQLRFWETSAVSSLKIDTHNLGRIKGLNGESQHSISICAYTRLD